MGLKSQDIEKINDQEGGKEGEKGGRERGGTLMDMDKSVVILGGG